MGKQKQKHTGNRQWRVALFIISVTLTDPGYSSELRLTHFYKD